MITAFIFHTVTSVENFSCESVSLSFYSSVIRQKQKKFEKICMIVQKDGVSTTYYGSASTKEEAQQIIQELLSEE